MLNNVPVYKFDLGTLKEPKAIMECARRNNWGAYVYSFTAGNSVLKYGMSMNNGRQSGERVYRQAAHMRGWDHKFRSGAGADILITLIEHEDQIERFIHKKDVSVTVWDLGRDITEDEIKIIEAELIERHVKEHNSKPIGNHKDHNKALRSKVVKKQHFNMLFSVVS